MTIRRDAADLAEARLIRVVYGGIAKIDSSHQIGTNYQVRASANPEVKNWIGHRAAELLREHDTVAFDSGSTNLNIAWHIRSPLPMTAITTSLPVIDCLCKRPEIDLIGLGGQFFPELQAFAGPLALTQIEDVRVDTFFLGASAVSQAGIYCANQYDVITKRAFMKIAGRVVVVADSSKFSSTRGMMRVTTLDKIDAIVVDTGLSKSDQAYVTDAGISLLYAPKVSPQYGPSCPDPGSL